MTKSVLYPSLDLIDFPSDPDRMFGNLRKEILNALRKVRRCDFDHQLEDKGGQLVNLLEFAQEACQDAMGMYTEDGEKQTKGKQAFFGAQIDDDPIAALATTNLTKLRSTEQPESGVGNDRRPKTKRNAS